MAIELKNSKLTYLGRTANGKSKLYERKNF